MSNSDEVKPVHLQYGLVAACMPNMAEDVPEDCLEEAVPTPDNNRLMLLETTSDPACVTCLDCQNSKIWEDLGFSALSKAA